MPRTKTVKRSSTKRTPATNNMGHYQHLEKEFMGIPGKFAGQVKKDIQTHKQKEAKLKTAWAKTKKSLKAAEARLKAAARNKTTATGKKQFATAKKVYAQVTKSHAALQKQWNELHAVLVKLTTKHAKLAALSKCLTQFNKDWTKQAKTNKTTTTKAKKRRKTRAAPAETFTRTTEESAYESPTTVYNDEPVGEEANTKASQVSLSPFGDTFIINQG